MSSAVLISGNVRSFARCLPTQLWHVYRKLDDPYFFCSVVDDQQANDIHLLEGYFPGKVFVEQVTQPDLNIPGTNTLASSDLGASQRHQFAKHAPYTISSSLQAILRQLWHLERVYAFARDIIESNALPAPEHFVRIRPDLWFHELNVSRFWHQTNTAFLPWWSRCGGCNDRFAVMDSVAAASYFGAFSRVKELIDDGCPLHPESLIAGSLANGKVEVCNTLCAVFRTLRTDGTTVAPVIYAGEQEAFAAAVA